MRIVFLLLALSGLLFGEKRSWYECEDEAIEYYLNEGASFYFSSLECSGGYGEIKCTFDLAPSPSSYIKPFLETKDAMTLGYGSGNNGYMGMRASPMQERLYTLEKIYAEALTEAENKISKALNEYTKCKKVIAPEETEAEAEAHKYDEHFKMLRFE